MNEKIIYGVNSKEQKIAELKNAKKSINNYVADSKELKNALDLLDKEINLIKDEDTEKEMLKKGYVKLDRLSHIIKECNSYEAYDLIVLIEEELHIKL